MTKLEWTSYDEAWTANLSQGHFENLEIRVLTDDESTRPTETQLKEVALVDSPVFGFLASSPRCV